MRILLPLKLYITIGLIFLGACAQATDSNDSKDGETSANSRMPENAPSTPEIPIVAPFDDDRLKRVPNEAVISPRGISYPSFDEMVKSGLLKGLGRKANYEILLQREDATHSYSCGRPLELNGDNFNYYRSSLKEEASVGAMDDLFCLLAARNGEFVSLLEIEIGMTDSPASEWKKLHSVSGSVIP